MDRKTNYYAAYTQSVESRYRGYFLALLVISAFFSCKKDKEMKSVFYSQTVKDSFEIYISTPALINPRISYNVIYYCDANLKSGRLLRELIKDKQYQRKVNNTIFVGIGHIGDFHVLRRRDFILPHITGSDTVAASSSYGQISRFYEFLKTELIPAINRTYKTNPDSNSIIGHSLGGLFVFYCLFRNDDLFANYYALSPSLWIDYYSIYKFDKLGLNNGRRKNLYFSTGGLEIFNKVKSGTRQMADYLNEKNYTHLVFNHAIHPWETHNSQVTPSLHYILK